MDKMIENGYIPKEMLKESMNLAGYAAVDTFGRVLSVSKDTVGAATVSSMKTVESVVSSSFSQTNKYTPDIYDVGNHGRGDFTSDMGRFMVGNSAMFIQNGVRIARYPASYVVKKTADFWYNEKRMQLVNEGSEKAGMLKIGDGNIKDFKYTEIISGASRKNILKYSDRFAKNAFEKNSVSGTGFDARAKAVLYKYKSNKYLRMIGRKNALHSYSDYLYSKGFSFSRSTKGVLKNQSRKITNSIISGNDPNGITNKVMWYGNKGIHIGAKSIGKIYSERARARRIISVVRHPIRTAKAIIRKVISLASSLMSFVASIPVFLSFFIAMLPIFIVLICIVSLIICLSSWFSSEDYTFSEIKVCDLGNSIKDGANVSAITDTSSEQYNLLYNNYYGEVKYDNWGLAYIYENGIRWYCNAMGTYYTSSIGDKFRVTLESGVKIYIVICDIKADAHTRQGNNDESTACVSADGSMLEFYGKWDTITYPKLVVNGYGSLNNDLDTDHAWSGPVVKIEKAVSSVYGNITSNPDFTYSEAWGNNNPYTACWMGQCTWFAWGRFYEIYGYSPGFTGNGYQCVGQLLSAHGDKFKFSTEPSVGAVFSYNPANNHVGIVVAVAGDTVTVQEGNVGSGDGFPGVSWNYPFSLSNASTPWGWWETTYSKSAMASRGATYAVPIASVNLSTASTTLISVNRAPSIDYLARIAYKKYGMSRQSVVDALKLCTNEGYTASDKLPYYMACTTINHYLAEPEKNLFVSWGGGDQSYYGKLNPKPESYIDDFAKIAFYKALMKLDRRAWDIHGMIPENRALAGGFAGTQHLNEAIYYEQTWVWGAYGRFKGYIAVWDSDAKWYP